MTYTITGCMQKETMVRRTKSYWRQTAVNIYACAFQRGCSCFIRWFFSDMPVLKCMYLGPPLFPNTHTHRLTRSHGCNLLTRQPRHTMFGCLLLTARGKYPCSGKEICGFINACMPIYRLRQRDCGNFVLLGFI